MDKDQSFKLVMLFGAFLSLAFLGGFSAVVVVLSIVLIFLFCSNPVRYSNYYTYIQLRINKCDNNIKQEDNG